LDGKIVPRQLLFDLIDAGYSGVINDSGFMFGDVNLNIPDAIDRCEDRPYPRGSIVSGAAGYG
jgi:hypothetical protein